ncbi:MAG: GntR family transcriptional regulator [Victivallales bacterium]
MTTIKLQATEALYQQVCSYFEKQICGGKLKAGDRIPATTQLSKQFNVTPDTIQKSLKLLMERGLIDRKPGRGTYVRKGFSSRTIGMVFGKEIFSDLNVIAYGALLRELTVQCEKEDWRLRLFITERNAGYDSAFYDLKSQVEAGNIRGIITFCSNDLINDWLEKECPAPSIHSVVDMDIEDMIRQGLDYLFAAGYRKPLILWMINSAWSKNAYLAASAEACRRYRVPEKNIILTEGKPDFGCGYDAVKRAWKQSSRPDSILSTNDAMLRGALYALLELGIKIPQEAGVITHANRGIEIFCHVPLTRLEFDPADFANESIRLLSSLIDGRKHTPRVFKARLVPGRSCGEPVTTRKKPIIVRNSAES